MFHQVTDKGLSKDGYILLPGWAVKIPSPGGIFILWSEITRKAVACINESSVGFFGVLLRKALGISKDGVFPIPLI